MKINVLVEETLSRVITVEADSLIDGIEKVRQMYNDEEIVLNESDFNGEVEISELEN